MLRRFLLVVVAHLAERGKTHRLQPGPDREASVENLLDERAHFRGRALCQILAVNWAVDVFLKLRLLRKIAMLDVCMDLRMLV